MARKKKQGGITLADIAKGAFMLATAAKLKTKQEVETGLREALPGASVLSVESGTRAKGRKFKIFAIAYQDIQFPVRATSRATFSSPENPPCLMTTTASSSFSISPERLERSGSGMG